MPSLTATPPVTGLPITYGATTLALLEPGPITSLAPRRGADLAGALRSEHGLRLPGPGESCMQDATRLIWFDRAHHLLIGVAPGAATAAAAYTTDQTDGWVAFALDGPGARAALARLTPLDLRPDVFAEGATARSLLQHAPLSLTRTGPEAYLLLTFRSMAGTAAHELARALRMTAAREISARAP